MGNSTVVYGVGFEFEYWRPAEPAPQLIPYVPTTPCPLRSATASGLSDAEIVAEVMQRMLEGTLSPRCRALLEDALKRCEK